MNTARTFEYVMGKSHVAFSAMLTAVTLPAANSVLGLGLEPEELALGVAIGGVAGVLPDIDHPDSFITHGVIPGSGIFGSFGKALGYLLCIPPRVIGVGARATMNHRGGTHSLIFAVAWALLAAPVYATIFSGIAILLFFILSPILSIFGVGFDVMDWIRWVFEHLPKTYPIVISSVFIGYIGHLIADSMTKVPVPWPWPFSKKRYSILPKGFRVTTDSFTETKLLRPIFIIILLAAFSWNIGVPLVDSVINKGAEAVKEKKESEKPKKKSKASGEKQSAKKTKR